MRLRYVLILLVLLLIGAGVVLLATSDLPAPVETREIPIPPERLPR